MPPLDRSFGVGYLEDQAPGGDRDSHIRTDRKAGSIEPASLKVQKGIGGGSRRIETKAAREAG